ncbi:MAG: enolase C-terminal domain-like protein, partial [Terriglobia bacterium]
MTASLFTVREVRLYERDVRLRMPFRFGVVTLTEAPQCFVRVRIEFADGRSQWGAAAEMLAPKWFDKNQALSNEDNFD